MIEGVQEELIRRFYQNRVLAHRVLFAHRHPAENPPFHVLMVNQFHHGGQNEGFMAFRGAAKSTLLEEGVVLKACFREFKNCLIIGSNETKAQERLAAIRHELKTNAYLREVFGSSTDLVVDTDGEIILANGIRIMALGRKQSLRGTKHNDMRPDLVLLDDLEEEEDVATPEARRKISKWFMTVLRPACDPGALRRIAATPLHPEALPGRLARDSSWHWSKYPIKYKDENGEWAASWAGRFPLTRAEAEALKTRGVKAESVEEIEESFMSQEMSSEFAAEYMCEAEVPENKAFKREMFTVAPQVKTWQATYCMFDPARTVKMNSALTGFAAWSWIGARLVVWDAWGKNLLPDQIVSAVFDAHEQHNPVFVGVEEDGLNEWLLQPIRAEQARRAMSIPLRAERAPKGKNDFIRGLQPYYNAREVIHAKQMPDLESGLLAFPSGKIDVPNALAYALKMRPGAPIYDSFGSRHIAEDMRIVSSQPVYLAMNATGSVVTGVLAQFVDGAIRIYDDWVREGDAGAVAAEIVQSANLAAGRQVKLFGGPRHFDQYNNVGLRQAVKGRVLEMQKGVPPEIGREWLRRQLEREHRGLPAVTVSTEARWTLNALAAGFSRALLKGGALAEAPEENEYRTLMEGFESFAGVLKLGSPDDSEGATNYAFTPGGVRYRSAFPGRQ